MKKLMMSLFIFIGAFSTCEARNIAYLQNKMGGQIVFTDENVKSCGGKGLLVFSRAEDGRVITGCWKADDNFVYVTWSTGDLRIYEVGALTLFDNVAKEAANERSI